VLNAVPGQNHEGATGTQAFSQETRGEPFHPDARIRVGYFLPSSMRRSLSQEDAMRRLTRPEVQMVCNAGGVLTKRFSRANIDRAMPALLKDCSNGGDANRSDRMSFGSVFHLKALNEIS